MARGLAGLGPAPRLQREGGAGAVRRGLRYSFVAALRAVVRLFLLFCDVFCALQGINAVSCCFVLLFCSASCCVKRAAACSGLHSRFCRSTPTQPHPTPPPKVGYTDPQEGGRRRPIVHRASIVEMAVPYAGGRRWRPFGGRVFWRCLLWAAVVVRRSRPATDGAVLALWVLAVVLGTGLDALWMACQPGQRQSKFRSTQGQRRSKLERPRPPSPRPFAALQPQMRLRRRGGGVGWGGGLGWFGGGMLPRQGVVLQPASLCRRKATVHP